MDREVPFTVKIIEMLIVYREHHVVAPIGKGVCGAEVVNIEAGHFLGT